MDQHTSPERARAVDRTTTTLPRPRPRPGARSPRPPVRRAGGAAAAREAMDAAIQNDLQGDEPCSGTDLPARMVALLNDSADMPLLPELVEALAADPHTSALSHLLRDWGTEDSDPSELLQCLARHAEVMDSLEALTPVVAMLSLRSVPSLLRSSRLEQLLHNLSQASAELASRNGTEALAAMPRILGVIDHHARRNGLPEAELPAAILRITQQVAGNPGVVERLLHNPTHPRREATPSVSAPPPCREEKLVIDRPAEITIRYLD